MKTLREPLFPRAATAPTAVACLALVLGAFAPAWASPVIPPSEFIPASRSSPPGPMATTLLHLRFNDTTTGEAGELPTASSGVTYEPGILGSGASIFAGDVLRYAATGNIDAASGTVEFWIKPSWNGNNGLDQMVLRLGLAGGILIGKDGGNFWRIIVNRFGGAGGPELGAGLFINDWVANQWHHAAFTWSPSALKVYIDGDLRAESTPPNPPPAVAATEVQIGADGGAAYVNAVLDEFIISSGERTIEEIRASFFAGLTILGLDASPDTLRAFPTWRVAPTLSASTNMGVLNIPPGSASWATSNAGVATFDATLAKIRAHGPGTASLTATLGAASAQVLVQVQAPVLPPVYEPVASFLAEPAEGALMEIPVVVLRYLPTADGVNLDTAINPDYWGLGPITLASLKSQIDTYDQRVKFGLEEGSRFRAYHVKPRPSLGYRVVGYITVYEPTPPGKVIGTSIGYPVYDADYFSIFERFDLEHFVDDLGVQEVWFWSSGLDASYPSYNPAIHRPENFRSGWESNMSSPTTGDISNSNRDNADLPIYGQTYTYYGYNFRRTQAEALHNHGHQLESILSHVAALQDGNSDLFWKQFVGQDASGNFITGRCGWTHMPPNTVSHYDYLNPSLVASDIANWTPAGGASAPVNVNTWGNLVFDWPDGITSFPQRVETQWYIYWWQSVPGYASGIHLGSDYLTNWWEFKGDWDGRILAGQGLHTATPPLGVNPEVGGIPSRLEFDSIFPNPVSSQTVVRFRTAGESRVEVGVLDVRGRRVRTLLDERRPGGAHQVSWDGRTSGRRADPGIYWVVITSGGERAAGKILVLH